MRSIDSVDMKPRGTQPTIIASGVFFIGRARLESPSRQEPGPIGGRPRCSLNTAPPSRSASAAGRPSGPLRPWKVSPLEWATMNHGGTPAAVKAPITEPAEVPTMRSALPGSQPVSRAIACSAPVSHAPPSTPPAPRTSPTFMASGATPGGRHD